jgi:ATP-binding protein involved in chromosome partitioning
MATLPPVPRAIERRDDGIVVDWDAEGHRWLYPARELRLGCPCAGCIDEMTGRALLEPASVPAGVRPLAVELVGAYGVRIRWSDGHDTGIYDFTRLRAGCGCAECRRGAGGPRQAPVK